MSARGGLACAITALAVVAGCRAADAPPRPPPVDAPCRADADPVDLACGPAPLDVDPDAIDSVAEFRRAMSALICERVLACPRVLFAYREWYCHSGYAEYAALAVGHDDSLVDLRLARACIHDMLEARDCSGTAFRRAENCRYLSEYPVGEPCGSSDECRRGYDGLYCRHGVCGFAAEGEPCLRCEPGLVCDSTTGLCAPAPDPVPPAGCAADVDCPSGSSCVAGICELHAPGDPCPDRVCPAGHRCDADSERCVPNLDTGSCCETEGDCDSVVCLDGYCAPVVAIGCPCTLDDECPLHVSACVDGVCTARPALGEPCAGTGPVCLGAICDAGVCRVARLGEPCAGDALCEGELVCGHGVCGPLLGLAEPCGSTVHGRCEPGLYCGEGSVCGPLLGEGDACGPGHPGACADPLRCDYREASPVCHPGATYLQDCVDWFCRFDHLSCVDGICTL